MCGPSATTRRRLIVNKCLRLRTPPNPLSALLYIHQSADELSFSQGDIIYIAVKTDEPMWKGVCWHLSSPLLPPPPNPPPPSPQQSGVLRGQVGWVPRRMVLDMDEEKELKAKADQVKILRCQAVKPYFSGEAGHLK